MKHEMSWKQINKKETENVLGNAIGFGILTITFYLIIIIFA